jgi:hypothetical protein
MGIEWFLLFIPIVLSVITLLIFKHKMTWFETLIPVVVGIIIICIMKFVMVKGLTNDTEYFSGYVVKATHYEDWNEYVHRTCTQTYQCGKSTCTRTYDCSYVDYHPEFWEVKLNTGRTVYITKSYYESLVKKFGNEYFVDKQRHFYTNDGDAYTTKFPGDFDNVVVFDWSGTYSNKPQTNETVFHFEDLTPKEMEGVMEYPEPKNWSQDVCIGCSSEENELLRKVNAIHGADKQIHTFIIQTEGKTPEFAERQRRHWKNGNKNELVIVTDKDSKWAKAFSWSDDKRLESECNALFQDANLTMSQKIDRLNHLIPTHWKRKHFDDFNYIQVHLRPTQLYWIAGVVTLVSLILLIIGVVNDVHQDGYRDHRGNWRRYNGRIFYR